MGYQILDTLSELESRIGQQRNRISSIYEFISLKGQEVWLVTSPMDVENRTQLVYGNSFLNSWIVDDIYNEDGVKINPFDLTEYNLNMTRDGDKLIMPVSLYTPHGTKIKKNDEVEYRYIISLTDYNVIPNRHTNHAIFKDKLSAISYQTWLKMVYPSDSLLDAINEKVINGKLIDWNNFLIKGIK